MKPTPNIALKVAVVRTGSTNTQVARRARIHPSRFSAIANGRIIPNETEQKRIARAIGDGSTVDQLFGSEAVAS